jgi:uroporphyrinogen decarboxylase
MSGPGEQLNRRERFLNVALFGKPDRIPLGVGGVRPLTRKAWMKQGLPEDQDVVDYLGFRDCTIGSRSFVTYPSEGFAWKPNPNAVNLGPDPPFEHRVLESDERYRIWTDSLGITQRGFQEDWKDGWMGFATRVFMDFPVKTREDFERIKRRYDAADPDRYPSDWDRIAAEFRDRDYPVCVTIRGPFWWTRDMTGLKKIVTGIYREPEFIKELMDFCAEFQIQVLERAFTDVEVDAVILNEDMGYKNGPMIGPDSVMEFMGEAYKMMSDFLRGHGVRVILVDSDGNCEPLIPVWLKLGINGITPNEAMAGMDVVKLGRRFPHLVMMGGIDKTRLARGREAIREEVMYKVPPLVKRGGYFPGVDHAVPPDISLENFSYFVSLLRELCGW